MSNIFIGKNIIRLHEVDSTNTHAQQLLREGRVFDGTLILAESQSSGRGQRGNTWETEPGKNWIGSFVLYPHFLSPAEGYWLTLIAGMAILKALKSFGFKGVVKWPNDVLAEADKKKVCGILTETTIRSGKVEHAIVGIGMNVNQTAFSLPQATSLCNELGDKIPLENITDELSVSFENYYLKLKNGKKEDLLNDYYQSLYGYGRQLDFRDFSGRDFEGIIRGINQHGHLLVESDAGLIAYGMKEISFVF